MPLYRDSENSYTLSFVDGDGEAEDVSARDFRMVYYQNGTTVTLTIGDGITLTNGGTDGIVGVTISKDRTNQFCSGTVRVQLFDDSGTDPVLTHEGSDTVEGLGFDA